MSTVINQNLNEIQTKHSSLTNQSNTFHRRPVHPRMGIHQAKYKCAVNTSVNDMTVSPSETVINNFKSNQMERFPVSQHKRLSMRENNHKLKDQFKRRSGQILLNRMMPATRQPIKARHSLRNKNTCEAINIIDMKNLLVTHNNSITDVHYSTICESQLSADIPPVVSSPTVSYSHQKIAILTNPEVRRRVSADSVSLKMLSSHSNVNANNEIPTIAKRQSTDSSYFISKSDLVNRNDTSSESRSNSWNTLQNIISSDFNDTSSAKSCIFTISSCSTSTLKKSFPSKCNRWSIGTKKRFSRRSSTGSLKTVQSDSECNDNTSSCMIVKDSNLNIKSEQPDMLKGIKRSARRTFSSLCNVLRHSNVSLITSSSTMNAKSFDAHGNKLDSDALDNTSNISTVGSYQVSNDSGNDSCTQETTSHHISVRHVTLSRPDFKDSFGLFVIKSEEGYRVTRLSDRLTQAKSFYQVNVGDEIVQVNGIDCKHLNTSQMQEIFKNNQSLSLTIMNQSVI
ncbi:unnamed protein product [Heterobilharzia americana]|nr:unnamed protein product [Heterobilharzia americana]